MLDVRRHPGLKRPAPALRTPFGGRKNQPPGHLLSGGAIAHPPRLAFAGVGPRAEGVDDLVGGALTGLHSAVEVALGLDRGVLPGEVAVLGGALRFAFHPGELGVLTDLPVGVGPACPLVAGPVVDGGLAVVLAGDAGQDRFELAQELLRAAGGRAAAK